MIRIPRECTLPTAERPLRLAEFDDLLGRVLGVERPEPLRLRLRLPGGLEPRIRDLTERESRCCSFFEFSLVRHGEAVLLDIAVPRARVDVLDGLNALADRAAAAGR
jgi:hypothetical protein